MGFDNNILASSFFLGQTLAAGLSGGICFFIFGALLRTSIGSVVVVNGVLAIASYAVLMGMVDRNQLTSWGSLLMCRCNDDDDDPEVAYHSDDNDYAMLRQPLSADYNVLVEQEEE